MSRNNSSRKVVSVDEQAFEQAGGQTVTDGGIPVVDEAPEFKPTVQQETQAKVDSNHPDGIAQDLSHLPLAQAERVQAREAELEHISAQSILGPQDGRAKRTRDVAEAERRDRRAAAEPSDPRERLSGEELADVNQQAAQMVEQLPGGTSRAIAARLIAERLLSGLELYAAVFATKQELLSAPGRILPVDEISEVDTDEVSLRGEIIELWDPSSPKIEQVGLVADETGTVKFTSWQRSDPTLVREGDTVRMETLKKNWYQGRCSVAVTYESRIHVLESADEADT